MTAMANANEKYKNLNQEHNELVKVTAEQEKLIARVKAANKNLRNDETSNLEFKENHSLLLADFQKISDDIVELQSAVDKKQYQYNTLKRLQEDILKKHQQRNELQLKLNTLKKAIAETMQKLSITRKNINDIKSRGDKKGENAVTLAKRIRLSMTSSKSTTASVLKNIFSDFHKNSNFVCLLG